MLNVLYFIVDYVIIKDLTPYTLTYFFCHAHIDAPRALTRAFNTGNKQDTLHVYFSSYECSVSWATLAENSAPLFYERRDTSMLALLLHMKR